MYNTYIISIKRAGFNVRSHVDARKIVKKYNGDNTNIKSDVKKSKYKNKKKSNNETKDRNLLSFFKLNTN